MQVHYDGAAVCTLSSLDSELQRLNAACCDANDIDDKCSGGVPQNCDYERVPVFPQNGFISPNHLSHHLD